MHKCLATTLIGLAVLAALGYAQVTSGRLEGTVTDSQGASVPGAQVKVVNAATAQQFENSTDDKGHWALPALPSATYTVTISHAGFKTAAVENVKIDAGVPATLNTTLEVGQLTETVEVQAGAEILQTASATVTSTLVGRQLHELPFTSRNLTELIVTQPGSATPGVPRSTSVYGLPQSALNVTLDGINIQDNSNRSSDGFFNAIFPRADAVEEMTITSAAAGAESNAEGALQMKLVTRSGSNNWHGGLFEYHRNEYFDANFYFNNELGLPRDHIIFNQFGGTIGGPLKANKLFIFLNPEIFRLPQTYTEPVGTILTPDAIKGNFSWGDNKGNILGTRNLYTLAGAAGFPSTPDPVILKSLNQIAALTDGNTGVVSRVPTNSDYNRNNLNFASKGGNYRRFYTGKLDYNITEKHHAALSYTYQTNVRRPDGVNVGTASPIYPGTQNVLNGTEAGNQGGIAFHAVANVRSTLTNHLTSEVLFGLTGGTVVFNNGVNAGDFSQWLGYAPTFNFITSPFRTTGQTRRNVPLKQGSANLTWSHGQHLINFGGSYTQVNSWTADSRGTQLVPAVTFNVISTDPILSSVFTAANFPGANTTDLQTNAPQLYALLTGRVSAISRSVVLDDQTRKYGNVQPIVKNRQREAGLYVQDSWRITSNLTFNLGVRGDRQGAPVNLNGIYTTAGYAGVWGVSGVGNMFAPGVLKGSAPQFSLAPDGQTGYNPTIQFSPSAGIALQLPKSKGPLGWLIGKSGNSVLRAGYAISTLREDASTFAIWGGNQGRTFNLNIDPTNTPSLFGAPGSVLFRNPLPSQAAPTIPSFPLAAVSPNSVNEFDPNLKIGYVQSWNIGFQRELTRDTVLEVRYVGNHGTRLWRNVNVNEINIFNNGFLQEFKAAQSNLAVARATNPTSNQYFGLAGQQALPMIVTAIGSNTDATTATRLAQGQAGALANAIATNATQMGRLTASGYPVNLFQVNPTLGSGAANLLQNGGNTNYNGLQIEVRRRLSKGLLLQGSYTWAHSITNEFSNGIAGGYTTLRNVGLDKSPSPYDIRHALKLNWIYELPFGPKRHFLGSMHNVVANKALEGWQLSSVARINTGAPIRFTSGRLTYNQNDSGVVLHNLTQKQLQDAISIRKTSTISGGVAQGVIYFLPQDLIDNSLAAFETGGKTLANLDPNKPYVGPANTAGELGQRLFLYNPLSQKWDVSLLKKTYIGERANVEFRVQALNVFNLTNFLLFAPGSNIAGNTAIGSAFGQVPTNGAYRDLSNTNDPGGRILEFVLRFNF